MTGSLSRRSPRVRDGASRRHVGATSIDHNHRLESNYQICRSALLAERTADGFWAGELASSALATGTAVSAFSLLPNRNDAIAALQRAGLEWLAKTQNSDGGWGDTIRSRSNLSTTLLVQSAFQLGDESPRFSGSLAATRAYVERSGGVAAIPARYGGDRTFAVPILANCSLAGLAEWRDVAALPFELAVLPQSWFRFVRLHVVSYALPALIAIGQLIHAKDPSRNWFARFVRQCAAGRTLAKLESLQPSSGGFLEAVPLTSFVTMSLLALGHVEHPVARRGIEFLVRSARADGSWPIDSNLSVWLTTLSINALAEDRPDAAVDDARTTRAWLLAQQCQTRHAFTGAAPGGWGWSHLPGSVPDADDTAGALLALRQLPPYDLPAVANGVHWLLDLQNSDGGWPTFCRGWGKLPFDQSAADLTAHVIRALVEWRPNCETAATRDVRTMRKRIPAAIARGMAYLRRVQRSDGTWVPLWFGNEHSADEQNATFGTARVLMVYREFEMCAELRRGIAALCALQNGDGGWGGATGTPSSVEESSLALESLASFAHESAVRSAVSRGVDWLLNQVESGTWKNPSPIGLYFAKLWYFEKLYPVIFSVAALGSAKRVMNGSLAAGG